MVQDVRRRLHAKIIQPAAARRAIRSRLRRRLPLEVWIGDSHALGMNRFPGHAFLTVGREQQVIQRVGPRLMWSLATKGFPESVERLAARIGRRAASGTVVPLFVAGEIDVRCHLVGREDYGFVVDYVERCAAVGRRMGAAKTVIVVPPPPSAACPNVEEFPILGTIEERAGAFARLRAALAAAVETRHDCVLLDASDDLMAVDGAIRPELTDDGCHTNAVGVASVRTRARALVREVVATTG